MAQRSPVPAFFPVDKAMWFHVFDREDQGEDRNTVADAYAELVAEGGLTARQGCGTRVAERVEPLGTCAGAPGRFRR
jgi:hypothetical protein